MENPSRRRVLAAGLAGTALGLIGGRAASAGTTPPPPTTPPPQRPTADDVELLGFAQSAEPTARDLYSASLEAGADDPAIGILRGNHQAYADILAGLLGTRAPDDRDNALYDELHSAFAVSDINALAATAYDLESTLVATHTGFLRSLRGIDGAQMIASILIVEARQCTVLADLGGRGDDFDALFVNDASALAVSGSTGG